MSLPFTRLRFKSPAPGARNSWVTIFSVILYFKAPPSASGVFAIDILWPPEVEIKNRKSKGNQAGED
ncbi:hypothetical protein BG011_008942 [Mortierella polycephala]|uniref:Uncharacterized protein n=1 Tax=Mortierella polycephala TaxID=41804 RepID=A0A9P6TWK7_9FUNG|nr:hypothetical protein BG011_008942 [Mortierella polycephala]